MKPKTNLLSIETRLYAGLVQEIVTLRRDHILAPTPPIRSISAIDVASVGMCADHLAEFRRRKVDREKQARVRTAVLTGKWSKIVLPEITRQREKYVRLLRAFKESRILVPSDKASNAMTRWNRFQDLKRYTNRPGGLHPYDWRLFQNKRRFVDRI